MRRRRALAAAAAGALTAAFPVAAGADRSIPVASVGGFHVGGDPVGLHGAAQRARLGAAAGATVVDPNGDFEHGQVYVHFVKLTRPRARYPLLLWHGGSLTGTVYETTPDGRAGWQQAFLRAGYSVFIVDAFGQGRAGWLRYPEFGPEPEFRTKAFAWEVFRIGPTGSYAAGGPLRRTHADSRFPAAAFDQFAKGLTPRFPIDLARQAPTHEAVLDRVCPCVLVTHSASGPMGFELAARRPDLVKGLVSIEPSGGPPSASAGPQGPHLIVWGDHLDLDRPDGDWAKLYSGARIHAERVRRAGSSVTWLDLPAEGVRGNSHLLMSDDNSAAIAARIHRWIKRNVR